MGPGAGPHAITGTATLHAPCRDRRSQTYSHPATPSKALTRLTLYIPHSGGS